MPKNVDAVFSRTLQCKEIQPSAEGLCSDGDDHFLMQLTRVHKNPFFCREMVDVGVDDNDDPLDDVDDGLLKKLDVDDDLLKQLAAVHRIPPSRALRDLPRY